MTPALIRAYRATTYHAAGIDIRIGRRSPAMDRLLASHHVREAVFITAWNPRSRRMPDGWNRRMQSRLVESTRRLAAMPASGTWRRWSEAHLLLFCSPARASVLGRRFHQYALVIVQQAQPAWLLLPSAMN